MARRGTIGKQVIKEKDERPVRLRKYPYLFLIVCEDEKTGPYYFKKFIELFPEETVFLRTVGTGKSSKGVVEQSIIEKNNLYVEANKDVDEVWTVFDKDDAEISPGNTLRFSEAFQLAQEERIKVAYSNEVFELWVLLHFVSVDAETPITRYEIYTLIEETINKIPAFTEFVYEHGNVTVIDILLSNGNEQKAIKRAIKLLEKYREKENLPIDANPSTTVLILVERLRELIDWYSYTP
ncbi:hypothetical protein MASR2M117_00450 [Paludibacter sp.]